ncbi:receptor for retinol uptake stra6-like isoform X2 [Lineus longissimus]
MDFLDDRGLRLSYAAVYGLTSSLCLRMILQDYPIKLTGPVFITVFIKLGTMVVYGFALYPLLAVLTTGTVLSLGMGTLYIWLFFIINMIHATDCAGDWNWRFYIEIVFLPAIPELACSLFLSISIPLRMIRILLSKWNDVDKQTFFENSYQAEYVRQLFRKPPKWCTTNFDSNMELTQRVKGKLRSLVELEESGFRYSPRILSTYAAGSILLFLIAYNLYSILITTMEAIINPFQAYIDEWNDTRTLFEVYKNVSSYEPDSYVGVVRIVNHWLGTALIVFCLSLTLAGVIGIVQSFLGLRAYRNDYLSACRGEFSNVGLGHSSLMRAFVSYSGYQVAYIFWAFVLQFFVFCIVFAILSYIFFIPLIYDSATWFLDYIRDYWPIVSVSLVVIIALNVTARCLFLQQRGKVFAIDNRRLLFCVMFFAFFYNVFVGLFSCLLRMGKSVVFGLFFLSRLDSSTLPKKFEKMDPGFEAYVGLIHVETAHTHPVLVTFVNMVKEAIRERRDQEKEQQLKETSASAKIVDYDELGSIERMEPDTDRSVKKSKQIRSRWFLSYTLINNLPLRATRKHYIDAEREKHKERQQRRCRKQGIELEVEVIDPNYPNKGSEDRSASMGNVSEKHGTQYETF